MFLLHSHQLLRSLAHWRSPKVAPPQRTSRSSSIIQRKRVGVGNLSKISEVDLEKGPDYSKHTPFPYSTWPLVTSRNVAPQDLNTREHRPHMGLERVWVWAWRREGHGPAPAIPHNLTQALSLHLKAQGQTPNESLAPSPPQTPTSLPVTSHHLSPSNLLSSDSFLTPCLLPLSKDQ